MKGRYTSKKIKFTNCNYSKNKKKALSVYHHRTFQIKY